MKKEYSCFLFITFLSFLHLGCDKDSLVEFTTPTTPPAVNFPYTPPSAHAGMDIWVGLPVDTAVLSASYTYTSPPPFNYLWKQVSGPGTAQIKDKDSMRTTISGLQKGTYTFEFSVTDNVGLSGKDTISVFVQEYNLPTGAEVLLAQQSWICPMGCTVIINCLPCYIPVNTPFQVYIKESISSPWLQAIPMSQWTSTTRYGYQVDGGKMILYTNDEPPGKTDIKIIY